MKALALALLLASVGCAHKHPKTDVQYAIPDSCARMRGTGCYMGADSHVHCAHIYIDPVCIAPKQ